MKLLSLLCFSLLCGCYPKEEIHKVIQIKLDSLFMYEEDHFVYFYSEHCGYCKLIKESIFEFASHCEQDFYYLNTDENDLIFKSDKDGIIGISSLEDFYIVGTPTLLFFENQSVKECYLGSSEISEYINAAK